jgi:glycosyltransferase involved in cell wall biosynthesis
MPNFCVIATPSTRAAVRVLTDGLHEHHPEARVTAIDGDGVPAAVPKMLQDALGGGSDVAVYIHPEAAVYGPLDQLLDLARERGVVLVRRAGAIPDDGELPDQHELLRVGRISDGLVAVGKSEAATRFLDWWSRHLELREEAEQPWLDLAPDLFPEAAVFEDTGYNVSFWNLHERPLERRGDEVLAAGRPLRLMQFEGFHPDRPYWLNERATRARVVDDPVLAELCGEHAERLRAAGWTGAEQYVDLDVVAGSSNGAQGGDAGLAVNVIGYLGDTLGLAEAARAYVKGLTAAGVPVTTTAIRPDLPLEAGAPKVERSGSHHPYQETTAAIEPTFNLVCLNGDHLMSFVHRRGERVLGGLPTIGQWGWETDVLPPSWLPAFRYVDEIWVYSTFVAQNLARLSPVPVVVVPMAITAPELGDVELPLLNDDRFTFLFMFDFFSTLRRKNPLAVVDAFTRAFAPDEGPRLLLKTLNAQSRPQAAEDLRARIAGRSDIEVLDDYLDPLQKSALLARAHCYVSLHRSEGFGLPLAESMALGTPVLATGYSGNTDFMTDQNSYLVDWSQTRVGPDCEIYPPEGTWAEPDVDHAAELMRRVWKHPEEAAAKAARAREDIARLYAPEVVGAIARERLERLRGRRSQVRRNGPRAAGESLETVRAALEMDIRQGVPPVPRGPGGFIRRLVLRLMFPFTYHERRLDGAMYDAVLELSADLEEQREYAQNDRARLRRVEYELTRRSDEQ